MYRFRFVILLIIVASMVVSACAPLPTVPPQPQPAAPTTAATAPAGAAAGLPDDAAPPDQQILHISLPEGKHFDTSRNEYEGFLTDDVWEPLVWLDADSKPYPAAADSWEVSQDGLTWTFHLRKDAKWSDGSPVTADDWVFSFRRLLDPKTANPYGWFYYGIKNAEKVQKGEITDITQLGVQKVDDNTIAITTGQPLPYMLQIVSFHAVVVPQAMVQKYGDDWASKPETALSNGPFMVKEWNKGKNVILAANPYYNGPHKPKLQQIVVDIIPESGAPLLQMYQANENDIVAVNGGPDLTQAAADPSLKQELDAYPSYTTYYIFFNTDQPPFNDLKVRQAFSHAIDRNAISQQVMKGLEVPAYSMLPNGFPCSQNTDPNIQAIQKYDPALAKQLMADANYPDGKGFPAEELWTREGQYVTQAEAIEGMLGNTLGITVKPNDVERSVYMDKLAAHQITLGLLQWGYDYVDPTNLLDWWGNQSRHTWKNTQFNQLIDQARSEIDLTKRCQLYDQAEKILIEDVGAVFVGYPVWGTLYKPYIGGVKVAEVGVRKPYKFLWADAYIKKH